MVAEATERGFFTFQQVDEFLPDEGGDATLIDCVVMLLEETGLALKDDPTVVAEQQRRQTVRQETENQLLVPENPVTSRDPIRMYLSQMGSIPLLTRDALNRALLARQMLLARENVAPMKVIERLAGLQAQQARPPFVGLWTRLEKFSREDLLKQLKRRRIVRVTVMRATVHLMTARDYLALRGTLQPMLAGMLPPKFIEALGGVPMAKICATGKKFFGAAGSFKDLRELMKAKHPKANHRVAALAVRMNVPLNGVPGEMTWGFFTNATWKLAEEWLGKPVSMGEDRAALVKKYLAAFGPATPADAQSWSGCKGLRAVFEDLRPKIKVFQNEKGQELFDLPRAPRPLADTPAPVRFIPDFDNLIL